MICLVSRDSISIDLDVSKRVQNSRNSGPRCAHEFGAARTLCAPREHPVSILRAPLHENCKMASGSKSRFAGAGLSPSPKKPAPSRPAPEAVTVILDPPNQVADLDLIYPSENNKTLCAVAKSCRHSLNNWGCWQWNPQISRWNNVHKDSVPHAPRLNGDLLECLQVTMQRFGESPACSQFSFRSTHNQVLTWEFLQSVEWNPIENQAEEPPAEPEADPRVSALEARVIGLESALAELREMLTPPS